MNFNAYIYIIVGISVCHVYTNMVLANGEAEMVGCGGGGELSNAEAYC